MSSPVIAAPGSANYGGAGFAAIQSFNPATDLVQVETRQDANYGALGIQAAGSNTVVTLGGGTSIEFLGLARISLSPANFRFV